MQPVAVADVATFLAEVAVAQPANARVEIGGPERLDLVDMARRTLDARGDDTRLEASWGGIFGPAMSGEVLLPGAEARIGPTTFDEWLSSQAVQ
jgi:uncharacterized protein YbjT (DUF2867 family)